MKKKIGILGGMGPSATIYLFELIVSLTKAEKDQDHITIITYNNPSTPDRTDAIFGKGSSPLEELIKGAEILKNAGADFILIPCVTAHYFLKEIEKHVNIKFIHMLEETREYILQLPGNLRRIGLIATKGTIQTRLFQDLFNNNGFEIVVPGEIEQELFMDAIYGLKGVKRGYRDEPHQKMVKIAEHLQNLKVDAVIGGCSEIPLILFQDDLNIPLINPMEIVARLAIKLAGYPHL